MSHDLHSYSRLSPMTEALTDLDTLPIANASAGGAHELTTIAALRGQMLYSAPVNAYVGAEAIGNEVPFGNFKIRINGLATEITAIAGTETVELYLGTIYGAGAAEGRNYNTQVLTAGTWFQVDNWVLNTGDDMGTYWICRSNIADKEWWQVKLWRPLPGKCAIEASRLGFAGPASAGGPVPPVAAALAHWSSATAAANTIGLPDGTNDLTERLRRDGRVGIKSDPLTDFDVNGSLTLGNAGFVFSATPVLFAINHTAIEFYSGLANITQSVVLPDAAAFNRRIVTVLIGLTQPTNKVVVTSAGGNIIDHDGSSKPSCTLSATGVRSVTWQSSGTTWTRLSQANCAITHEHRITLGDFPTASIFNGQTYSAAEWERPTFNWAWTNTSGAAWNTAANVYQGLSCRINATGNWELYGDMFGFAENWKVDMTIRNIVGTHQRFGVFN